MRAGSSWNGLAAKTPLWRGALRCTQCLLPGSHPAYSKVNFHTVSHPGQYRSPAPREPWLLAVRGARGRGLQNKHSSLRAGETASRLRWRGSVGAGLILRRRTAVRGWSRTAGERDAHTPLPPNLLPPMRRVCATSVSILLTSACHAMQKCVCTHDSALAKHGPRPRGMSLSATFRSHRNASPVPPVHHTLKSQPSRFNSFHTLFSRENQVGRSQRVCSAAPAPPFARHIHQHRAKATAVSGRVPQARGGAVMDGLRQHAAKAAAAWREWGALHVSCGGPAASPASMQL
jgi:hypothetical protein